MCRHNFPPPNPHLASGSERKTAGFGVRAQAPNAGQNNRNGFLFLGQGRIVLAFSYEKFPALVL
jgi:hypothetical protein